MFYVYLLASKPYGTLYVGVTSDLAKRVSEHKSKAVSGFTARYRVDTLVWFEAHESVEAAIHREKQDQGMETGVEIQPDRARQPALDRSVLRLGALTRCHVRRP